MLSVGLLGMRIAEVLVHMLLSAWGSLMSQMQFRTADPRPENAMQILTQQQTARQEEYSHVHARLQLLLIHETEIA